MADRLHLAIRPSDDKDEAVQRFLDAIRQWTRRTVDAFPDGYVSDSHDGGTFMVPWVPYIRATDDPVPLDFMRRYRDAAKRHFEKTGQWLDGYWRRQEAHHGTEHFDIFLRALWQLDPADPHTVEQLEDAAEHIGNWKDGLPQWYDADANLFRSMHLGTEVVGEPTCNIPDHLRLVSLCLLAHAMTRRERYLRLAREYGLRWADAVTRAETLPIGIDADGPVYDLGEDETTYRSFVGAAPKDLSQNLSRAENLIASGAPDLFLELWQRTHVREFRGAAERLVDLATDVLASPIAWQAQAAVARYRRQTTDTRYDNAVATLPPEALRPVQTLTLVPAPDTPCTSGPMGMRGDKPDWLDEDGAPAPSPLLQALAAEVAQDDALATQALDLALAHFHLAQQAFGDTCEHGCGSRSLAAVARGHGRLNGAGVVSEVLYQQQGKKLISLYPDELPHLDRKLTQALHPLQTATSEGSQAPPPPIPAR